MRVKPACKGDAPHAMAERCYYCQKGVVCALCERCERGLCELCVRACDECKVTSCTYCLVVDYEQRVERILCFGCCEEVGTRKECDGSAGCGHGDGDVMMALG